MRRAGPYTIALGAAALLGAGLTAAEAASCAVSDLQALAPPGVTIEAATPRPASGSAGTGLPAHCAVTARLPSPGVDGGPEGRIGFRLALPDEGWNGRFLMTGGGGFDGGYANFFDGFHGLSRGYATAATDTGHAGGDTAEWALRDPTKIHDFGYRAVHLVRDAAVAVTAAWGGRRVEQAYFAGCSTGGRMALMAAQRYPADFDGIIAGAPAWDYDGLMMSFAWNERALLRSPAHAIPANKLPAIQAAETAQCAASGAVVGGIITDPPRCRFDPGALLCRGGDAADCLTAEQVESLRAIHAGPRTTAGLPLYPGLPVGTEDAGNWPVWVTGTKPPGEGAGSAGRAAYLAAGWPNQLFFAQQYMKYLFFPLAEQDPARDALAFDFDRDPVRRFALAPTQDPTPDLRAFQERGGKLILYGGWGDPVVPLPRTIEYVRALWATTGGREAASRFSRLYPVPGMPHCAGGNVPNVFGQPYLAAPPRDAAHDITAALDEWVRHGTAPGPIVATQYPGNDATAPAQREMPLCPYPARVVFQGGPPADARSYACR